jgi:ubiquinone biosynthesis protein
MKYGFGDIFSRIRGERIIENLLRAVSRKPEREKISKLSREARLRKALEELGPTFVKAGQILSTRPDLIGPELIREFEKLQDNVPPFSFDLVRNTIETELGSPLEQIFKNFDEIPLAAASIGQVHRAQLPDGHNVVVKIQRPGILKIIQVDLKILRHLATLTEKHMEEWELQQPTMIVDEFSRMIDKELDYSLEAAHMERFASQFADEETIHVPEVFHKLSSQRVLTMEYVEGIKASEISLLEQSGLDTALLAARGADLMMKQVFVHGFIHADPHPGNVLFLENNVICYLDFGMMSRVSRKQMESLVDAATYAVKNDEIRLTDTLLRIVDCDREPDRKNLENNISELLDRYLFSDLEDLDLSQILTNVMKVITRYRLRIPPDFYIMMKAIAASQALGRKLDPGFKYEEAMTPFLTRIKLEKLLPQRIFKDLFDVTRESAELLKEIPQETSTILKQIARGKAQIQLEHRGFETMLSTFDKISNRLSFAILVASLVIGSSVIVLSGVPPKWNNIPIIGLAGFIVAAVMAFFLIITILRHGKM